MLYDQLIRNLQAQAIGYTSMLEALEAEAMLPAAADLEDLIACQQEKEKAAHQVRELEEDRARTVAQLAGPLNLPLNSKLEVLAQTTDELRGQRLLQLKSELIDLVQHIEAQAHFVAERGVVRSNCILEVQENLAKHLNRSKTYGKTGQLSKHAGGFIYRGKV